MVNKPGPASGYLWGEAGMTCSLTQQLREALRPSRRRVGEKRLSKLLIQGAACRVGAEWPAPLGALQRVLPPQPMGTEAGTVWTPRD